MAHMSEKVIWPITAPGVCAQSSMDCRLAPKRMSPNGLKPFIHSLFWNKWIRRKRPVRIPNTMYTCFTNMHMNIRYGEGSKDLCLQQQTAAAKRFWHCILTTNKLVWLAGTVSSTWHQKRMIASSHCAKMKPKYPRQECCHFALWCHLEPDSA